ncbi:nodulation protein NfeD [Victivallis sp. Marseille-Q1083]|uniref:NfeD family protein n=1 Tax=Victivallis sp. Marseille-Q1083 TaxID=2717288 RepID=UPI00158DC474|nr:nodulation protein NfeD [Victivallis sp. Marseille-Q1083]
MILRLKRLAPVIPLLCLALAAWLFNTAAKPPPEYVADAQNVVYYLPQFLEFEEISESEMRFLKKTLDRAAEEQVKAVIFELNTPGGRIDVALKYVSILLKSKVPVIAYVNPQGISAGMVVALAADRIAINPDGLIGDAMPLEITIEGVRPITAPPAEKTSETANDEKTTAESIVEEAKELSEQIDRPEAAPNRHTDRSLTDQKFLTVFFKALQVLAEKNGRPVKIVRAMADPYVQLTEEADGIAHTEVSPLTLGGREAAKLGVVDYLAKNRSDLLTQLNLGDAQVQEIRRTAWEQVVQFLSHPVLAGALLVLGIVGIFIEIKTPGFGVPGILGLTALTLFFLGHVASGASDWGPIVIFFVGLLLLLLEIFVIPGFGIVGILGGGCMIISFCLAFGWEQLLFGSQVVAVSLLVALGIIIALIVYVLPKSRLLNPLTLKTNENSSDGYVSVEADNTLIGKVGQVAAQLRPAGVIVIGDKRYDAVSDGELIEAGSNVVVIKCNGFQLVVKRIK